MLAISTDPGWRQLRWHEEEIQRLLEEIRQGLDRLVERQAHMAAECKRTAAMCEQMGRMKRALDDKGAEQDAFYKCVTTFYECTQRMHATKQSVAASTDTLVKMTRRLLAMEWPTPRH
jgi:hypothetical protein